MASAAPAIRTVRAVVVDYDGGELTARCVASLLGSSWPGALEVVVVDNASRLRVTERLAPDERVRVVRAPRNLGFAGGANLGIGSLEGIDAVALVNNDAVVAPGWLDPLVAALDADPGLGAASPKIVFTGRYRQLRLSTSSRLRLVRVDVAGALHLSPDVAAPSGSGAGRHTPVERELTGWVDDGDEEVRVAFELDAPAEVVLAVGDAAVTAELGVGRHELGVHGAGAPCTVINNVGTAWRADGYGFDVGYLDPDDGRHDAPADLDAWCGGAVLLPRRYLDAVGRFDERLFLYYEDLDLSLRGRALGWRYHLVPSSVVEHDHSATAVAGSPRAERCKERNRLLLLLRHRGAGAFAAAAGRFVLSTLSYLRRDVLVPLARGRRPSSTIVGYRTRALLAAVRLAPRFRPGSAPPVTPGATRSPSTPAAPG